MNNGPLSVWNVLKDHGTGRAVRVERGLVDSQDALVIHNHTAVILTDRGFVSIGDVEGRAMFQTVLVYNLKEKKFIHKMQVSLAFSLVILRTDMLSQTLCKYEMCVKL